MAFCRMVRKVYSKKVASKLAIGSSAGTAFQLEGTASAKRPGDENELSVLEEHKEGSVTGT